jgi:hypothetical protein
MQALILARLLGQQISMESINVCLSVLFLEKLRFIILHFITLLYRNGALYTGWHFHCYWLETWVRYSAVSSMLTNNQVVSGKSNPFHIL